MWRGSNSAHSVRVIQGDIGVVKNACSALDAVMKKANIALIATALLVALMRPASAVEPVAPYNWTGFYVGLNAGWSWGKADTTTSLPALPATFTDSTRPTGVIGGAQFGYNWQGSSRWIVGLESDIQVSGASATSNPDSATNIFPFSSGYYSRKHGAFS